MRAWLVLVCGALIAGCPSRKPPAETPSEPRPTFVDVDLSREYALLNSGLLSELTDEERRTGVRRPRHVRTRGTPGRPG